MSGTEISSFQEKSGAIIVMPRSSKAWLGAEAMWITAAGWGAAAERKLGNSWIITADTIASPKEVMEYPLLSKNASHEQKAIEMRLFPQLLKTLVKDIILWAKSKKFSMPSGVPWDSSQISFVWEQHDLFPGPGKSIARKYRVPFVIYVHAPQVWETSKWGVRRPVWGKILEWFEARSLNGADVVACVSNQVRQKLVQMGIPESKIIVSPMAVDPDLFATDKSEVARLKKALGFADKFVIGWTGSFRGFHGLEHLIEAFRDVKALRDNAALVLIGDGKERSAIELLAATLRLTDSVYFLGKKAFSEIPTYLALFDAAIVSAKSAHDFHYSPLKLREYLAAGRPTIAPKAGDIAVNYTDGKHLLLYDPGNVSNIKDKIIQLMDDASLRHALAENGLKYVSYSGTWDSELKRVLSFFSRHSTSAASV